LYLKSLEIIGFKSFADKTRLEFEPGMTAIVGPNGCGKSNVSDAIRWVLGEQSAKALRGANMADVIFNGTDAHKALNMAEVSITLADCEASLGMEFNEVTVTRRVFRSGEGQYFINKAPCRLKDIQRLFMDTGIGTNSYSLMEQGRIDKILSSHPEDRRAVFEEASGITKYKADKKEAIRKLEQTEANLLRLADIIREVKRQIISLQRQAGKARRYKELQDRLRALDLFATKERILSLDAEIKTLEGRLAAVNDQAEAARQDVDQTEAKATEMRADLADLEKKIAAAVEAASAARNELQRADEQVRFNQERITELQQLSERDTRDAEEARIRLEQHQQSLTELEAEHGRSETEHAKVEKELAEHVERLTLCEKEFEEAGKLIHKLRTEQIDSDMRVAKLQNELSALDAEERTNVIRRERLAAELNELQRAQEIFATRQSETQGRLSQLRGDAQHCSEQLELLLGQQTDKAQATSALKQHISDLKVQLAGRKAQVELFQASSKEREGFADGARLILDPASDLQFDRQHLLGPLAELIQVERDYHLALDAALRPWMDAIVVSNDATARSLITQLEAAAGGSARLLFTGGEKYSPPESPVGRRLMEAVTCNDQLRPVLERLIGDVFVVPTVADVPAPCPSNLTFVTTKGALIGATGEAEYWTRDNAQANPLARQQMLEEWNAEIHKLSASILAAETNLQTLVQEETSVASLIKQARTALEESRRAVAVSDGEFQVIAQEAKQAADRVETVSWELKQLNEQHHSGDDRRAGIITDIDNLRKRQDDIRAAIVSKTDDQRELEQRRSRALAEVTERRIRFSECRQKLENMSHRREQVAARIDEMESLIEERSRGVDSYRARIAELNQAVATTTARLQPLQEEVTRHNQVTEETKGKRDILTAAINALEMELRQKRGTLENIRGQKSQCDIELAEQRLRRQNLIDRSTADYRVTLDLVMAAPEPEWENGIKLDRDQLETTVAEIKTKLEAMGPVNLVAIEEHKELEDRLAFLTIQQTDLVNAKQQLMDMIREINKKTTEMFQATFEAVNVNFQQMFTKLFGGGTAKLVLIDDGDVLESGIEIIARPPGKKLQTVSLLSGGERTMTAVALLFSLYLVKPSPFCVLDELDAALDDANIGRFVRTVQGFLERSQFVVITHNRQTISASRALYGVTMEQQGISKIVSVKFNDGDREKPEPPPSVTPAQPTPEPVSP
jgi:chromosome segregation protein